MQIKHVNFQIKKKLQIIRHCLGLKQIVKVLCADLDKSCIN